jgi:hypothetical protein
MLSWVKTYELYKIAYEKYYTDMTSRASTQSRAHTTTVYQRNDVFTNNNTINDDDFKELDINSTTGATIQNAIVVAEDIFDIQDPAHIFNTQYLSKSLKEQITKLDKEGGVLLYRTKQLTGALSQYVQQHHYEELCQYSIAPYTTIDAYSTSPDAFTKKPSIWQQLREQMEKNQILGKPVDFGIEEPDYDTMVTHATQYAIELVITPPLTPLLDVYLSLKCHTKDYKLYQICQFHTKIKKRQSDYNIPIHLQSPDKWIAAISAIKQITTVYTAVERLQCLLTCCKYIYHTYKLLIQSRTKAYDVLKAEVSNGVIIDEFVRNYAVNFDEIDANDYAKITQINDPGEFLIKRIDEWPRKEYISWRKNRPIIEDEIPYGKYVMTNKFPTVKEINDAKYGILVQFTRGKMQNGEQIDQKIDDEEKMDRNNVGKDEIIKQFILIKDDIGPSSSLCADDFFPIFVYVIMNAKIAKLETIKQFIGSMAPRVSLTGEVGYYFTVFEAVIEYIDTLNHGA